MSVSIDVTRVLLADGAMVVVRELCPTDHDQVVALHQAMPEEDRYLRFFSAVLPPNWRMLRVFKDLGLDVAMKPDFDVIRVTINLEPDDRYLDAVADRERVADDASLQALLRPRSVTVIGASRKHGSVGHAVLS